jgi:hypothetical protein
MRKLVAAPVLCLLAVSTFGCDMNRPPVQAPEQAWTTMHGRLAEQCSAKHPDAIPADKFYEFALDAHKEATPQTQQLIEKDVLNACKGTDGADCYNTGFIQAEIQSGNDAAFAKKVCAKL